MIDHIALNVRDAERSRSFYAAAFAPIDIVLVMSVTPEETGEAGSAFGFGSEGKPFFWVGDRKKAGEGTHVAFALRTRAEVDAFHAAALEAGGQDNGAPGLRPDYAPDYYAAFVLDLDGNNIEAVTRSAA